MAYFLKNGIKDTENIIQEQYISELGKLLNEMTELGCLKLNHFRNEY